MITRGDLQEKPWTDALQLNEEQTEELIQDLINSLNKQPEISATWTCSGDTLVATARQRLDGRESPIFFVCKIRKCLMTKRAVPSSRSLMGMVHLGGISVAGGIFIDSALLRDERA